MTSLKSLLLDQIASHSGFQVRDAVKLIYQSHFGGGHLITDPDAARSRLEAELRDCPGPADPLTEPIGGGYARLNLRPASQCLSAGTVFALFLLSSQGNSGDMESFRQDLPVLYELGFDRGEVDAFLREYSGQGCPMLSHSDAYRAANRPAYRVIDERYVPLLDILSAVDSLSHGEAPVIVGIDGMCASGKTTVAEALSQIYSAPVYHADDYFLPPELRTAERLSAPGGNLHRERLMSEVLSPLSHGAAPVTRRFDCHTGALEPPVTHAVARVNIVEGSYCLHSELEGLYTLKIALRTAPETQRARLALRDPGSLGTFLDRWIPLENSYIASTALYARANIVLDT